jgi:hypothetical protein
VDVIRAFQPTILVGATAQAGAVPRAMLEEMAKHVARPLILPLSNPTSKSECMPKDALDWTGGRAIVVSGSPFEVVRTARDARLGRAIPDAEIEETIRRAVWYPSYIIGWHLFLIDGAVLQDLVDLGGEYVRALDVPGVEFEVQRECVVGDAL